MRTICLLLALCVACDDESETAEPTETVPSVEAPEAEAPSAEPAAEAPATTTGFIEVKVDGELVRYEYLAADDNTAAANGTFLKATAGPDSDEGLKVLLANVDVRTLEFPAEIVHDVGAMRLASLTYRDAEGTSITLPFRDPPLTCETFDDQLLKCTFSGTAAGESGPVELTDGRIEVQLTENAARDAFIHATGTAAP